MTKTICDICGKEMPTAKFADDIENMNFCMSSHGKIWDICYACRLSLNKWMTRRRQNTESEENCFQPKSNETSYSQQDHNEEVAKVFQLGVGFGFIDGLKEK